MKCRCCEARRRVIPCSLRWTLSPQANVGPEHLMFPIVLRRTTEEIAMQTVRTLTVQSPLGDRDRWPVTGPIYGLVERDQDQSKRHGRRWCNWLFRSEDAEAQVPTGPISPIHY
jgi:hypothetical protein